MSSTEQDNLLSEQLDELLELRPFPAAASRLISCCEDESVNVRELCEIIKCDPGMSVRLLQVANSPLYGFSGKIRSVDHATVILGLRALRDLAISTAVGEVFDHGDAATSEARRNLWHHSLACGVISRCLGQATGSVSPEEAFLAGVVHDVGKLFLYDHQPLTYRELVANSRSANTLEAEQEAFGITHTAIGQRCGQNWGLPDEVNDVIAFHHTPQDSDYSNGLVQTVAAANLLSRIWDDPASLACDPRAVAVFAQADIDLSDEQLLVLREEVQINLDAIREVCG